VAKAKQQTASKNRPTKLEFEGRLNGRSVDEVIAAVARDFCLGMGASDVLRAVNEELGTRLRREDPMRFLRQAAVEKRLQYTAPREAEWSQKLQETFELKAVRVVRTSQLDDVALYGAKMLLDLVKKRANPSSAEKRGRRSQNGGTTARPKCVRVGFGGGDTLHALASQLSQPLAEAAPEHLPPTLCMHAMVGSSLMTSITTPSYFFGKFIDSPDADLDIRFFNLPAPSVVSPATYRVLSKEPVIAEALGFREELDIVCSSAGNWHDPHAYFRRVLERWSPSTLERIRAAGCVGDLLWLPLDREGNSLSEKRVKGSETRAMTMLSELDQLAELIDNGLDCLVVLSPCRQCGMPKSEVLSAILRAGLVTHLVVDHRTAAPVVQEIK
jgi:DNA-binding transcriptional regulator LsrR (DeoR family)